MNVPQTEAKLVAASTLLVQDQAQAKPVPDNPAIRLGLKPAPLMKEAIEAIAAKHGIDLYSGKSRISLKLSHCCHIIAEDNGSFLRQEA